MVFISLKQFSCINGRPSKIEDTVKCNRELSVTVKEEEVTFSVKYRLVAQICHAGQFTQGHYWCNSFRNSKWYHCNDEVAPGFNPVGLDNESAYVLAYQKI